MGIEARGGHDLEIPSAARQALRQCAVRPLHVEDRRRRHDVDDSRVRRRVDRRAGGGVMQRHVDDQRAAAARVERDRHPALAVDCRGGGLRVAAHAARARLDTQRPVEHAGELHRDQDALADARTGRRQHLHHARRRRRTRHRDPSQRQLRLVHGAQGMRRIADGLLAVRDDDQAFDRLHGMDCECRLERSLDVGRRCLETGGGRGSDRRGRRWPAGEFEPPRRSVARDALGVRHVRDCLIGGRARHALGAIDQHEPSRLAARVEPRNAEQRRDHDRKRGQLQREREPSAIARRAHATRTASRTLNRRP